MTDQASGGGAGPNDAGPSRLLHIFPTFAVGGAQMRFATLANIFGAEFRHLVFAMDGCYDCRAQLDPAVKFETPEIAYDKGKVLHNIVVFRRALQHLRPDLLLTYNWGSVEWAVAASLLPGLRHLHTEDGFGPGEEHGPFWRRSAFRRIALRKAEKVIVPSLVLRDIAKSAWHIPKRRLAYIANGIDCALYADKPAPAMLPEAFRADDTLLIGTLATLRKEKNLYRLLAAFQIVHASLPNARLVVVGDGVERTGLEERTRQMGLREQVHFAGHLQQPERIVGLFDVFALSSDTEQMPISVLEAMAAGLPVAAVAVGDVPGMVARENADCIVRRGDGEALARVILELLRSPERRLEIGAANRARAAQHYSLEQMLRQHGDLWRGAAPGAAAPG